MKRMKAHGAPDVRTVQVGGTIKHKKDLNGNLVAVEGPPPEMPFDICVNGEIVCATFTHWHAKHIEEALRLHPFVKIPPVPEYDPDLDEVVLR